MPAARPASLALVAVLALTAGCAGCWWGLPTDRRAIAERYQAFQRALDEDRLADAYAIMAPDYRAAYSLADFTAQPPGFGSQGLEADFRRRGNRTWAYLYPYELGWLELANGPEIELERVDGVWYLTGEVQYYID